MNFYIAEPVTRLPLFNFLVRYIFTEVLYNVNGKIYFGEFTLYPAAGMGAFIPEEWDEKLGSMLVLS